MLVYNGSIGRIFPAAVILGALAGCSLFGGPDSFLDPTDASEPKNAFEELVAAAIEKAVVTDKDIPDFGLLEDPSKIVVSRITADGDTLTSGALPDADSVEFVLAWPETIQTKADQDGDFLHLRVGNVEISGPDATISVSTTWAVGRSSETVYLSGGGYQLLYSRTDGNWVFDRVLVAWIS